MLPTPEAEVSVKNLTDTAIQFAVRPWVNNADFVTVSSHTLESCILAFEAAGIDFKSSLVEAAKKN